jgi:hypothetical protein
VALVTATSIVILFGLSCARPVAVMYRAVTSGGPPAWKEGRDICWGDEKFLLVPPDYIIRDGNLYLRIQSQMNLVILMGVSDDEWDDDRVGTFRQAHPDLEAYWPDRSRPDGGVKWLRVKSP